MKDWGEKILSRVKPAKRHGSLPPLFKDNYNDWEYAKRMAKKAAKKVAK